MERYPLVSVIVITYNSSEFVLEALESIKNQTYSPIELIISDDRSTDETLNLCRKWIAQNHSYFTNVKLLIVDYNTGISANCNRGYNAASGEWLKFIAGDDALEHDVIQRYVDHINDNEYINILYSNVIEYWNEFKENCIIATNYNGNDLLINKESITAQEQYKLLLKSNKIWASTLFFKSPALRAVNGFDERYSTFEDRPLLLKLTKYGYKIHFLNINGAKYRRHYHSVQSFRQKIFINQFRLERSLYFIDNHKFDLSENEYNYYKLTYRKDKMIYNYLNKNSIIVKSIDWILTTCIRLFVKFSSKKIF